MLIIDQTNLGLLDLTSPIEFLENCLRRKGDDSQMFLLRRADDFLGKSLSSQKRDCVTGIPDTQGPHIWASVRLSSVLSALLCPLHLVSSYSSLNVHVLCAQGILSWASPPFRLSLALRQKHSYSIFYCCFLLFLL